MNRLARMIALSLVSCSVAVQADSPVETEPIGDAETETKDAGISFIDPEDGAFDISAFLSTKAGFLPLAIPITEPAVGYGLSLGLTFFHDKPKPVPGKDGEPDRLLMPSATVVFGAGTENGTWAGGLAHVGVWDDGRIRYLGAAGYASLDLEWYGQGGAFGDRAIDYDNDVFFLIQRLTFQIGDSDFFLGPQYRLVSSDATFETSAILPGIPPAEFDSTTAGLGLTLSYDSLDHPFKPTRGFRAEIGYEQMAESLGGDFNYGNLNAFAISYFPLSENVVLGLNATGKYSTGNAPFYDLPSLDLRGLQRGRYVDDIVASIEAELAFELSPRWTALAFGGVGRAADSFDSLIDADDQISGGVGVRYMIAREYGLSMGADLAFGDDRTTLYISVGTGWMRP